MGVEDTSGPFQQLGIASALGTYPGNEAKYSFK